MALNPQPSLEEIRGYYDETHFVEDRGGYHQQYQAYLQNNSIPLSYFRFFERFENIIRETGKKMGKAQGGEKNLPLRLLEIGPGMGVFMHMAKRQGWQVKGVDISPYACHYAQTQLGLDMYCGELLTWNAGEPPFDWIAMLDSLEHVLNPVAVLKRARELIAPRGLLFLSLPRQDSLVDQLSLTINRFTFEKFQAPAERVYKREHLFYFTPETARKILDLCGWEVLEIQRDESIVPLIHTGGQEKMALTVIFTLARLLKKENLMLIWARPK